MRAAFITTNLRGGGAEKAMLRVASGLAARGHTVDFVVLEGVLDYSPPPGLNVRALTPSGEAAGKGWVGKRWSAWRLRRLLRSLARTQPFDLVVSTLPYCDEVVALARLAPAWYRIANTLSVEIELLRRRDPAKADRRHARYRRLYGASNLLAVSDGVARDLRETLGFASANIVRIYNPIDVPAIQALALQPEPGLPAEPYVVHVGRFAPQKRHDLLFEAYRRARLPHRLLLLTEPNPGLARLIAEAGLAERVHVVGFQSNPYPWIASAKLLVLCSDHEGMPNVLVEALACGTRVASTDCPSGPREVLEGEMARYLVPCGDADALARAMREALEARPPRAPEVLKRFAVSGVIAQYESLPAMGRPS